MHKTHFHNRVQNEAAHTKVHLHSFCIFFLQKVSKYVNESQIYILLDIKHTRLIHNAHLVRTLFCALSISLASCYTNPEHVYRGPDKLNMKRVIKIIKECIDKYFKMDF